jgi:hypothetical protein
MSEPWDEVDAKHGSPRSAQIDASGAIVVDFAMPKPDARNTMFKPFTVSPYASDASYTSDASTSDDGSDNSFSFDFEYIKYTVVGLLKERKWRFALLGFILAFMVLVASLAGTAATSQEKSASTFYSLFDTPVPVHAPTSSPSASTTPTTKPSESPSSMPSIWVQSISDPFQLRMYWHSGYYWQESISEEWYCAECISCRDYTVFDGISADCTSSGDSTASCREGDLMWLNNCKDKTKDFRFETMTNLNSGDQIRVHNTSLCFSSVRNRYLELRPCDSFDSRQLWNPVVNLKKFEMRPYDQRFLSTQEAMCLSQTHHPKEEEVVGLHSCELNLRDTTNYWEEYHQ